MKTILLQLLFLFTNILLICGTSFADEWKYIGYATLNNSDTFYVFVDKVENKSSGNQKFILEKHVFNNQQVIGENTIYMSAVIERILDCGQKKISNQKAVLYDSNGAEIINFTPETSTGYEIITDGRNINYSVYKEFCKDT